MSTTANASASSATHATSPDNTSPDSTSPDNTSPDNTSPDNTSPDNTGPDNTSLENSSPASSNPSQPTTTGQATFVVFSGEMDRQLAAFHMATAGAASGMRTTMFFAFWGVTALRSRTKRASGKSVMDRMFGFMLPRGARALPTSRMNFWGMGPKLFRWRMGKKHMAALPELLEQARALGTRLIACEASMDMLGIRPEELIDGIEVAGAASCMREASRSDTTMFV